jgi:hypothetical protein
LGKKLKKGKEGQFLKKIFGKKVRKGKIGLIFKKKFWGKNSIK